MEQVVDNPEDVNTYAWRRYLPTIAVLLKIDATDRLALGDWQDSKLAEGEAPITLRYADSKAEMSRNIKMLLAKIQSILRDRRISTERVDAVSSSPEPTSLLIERQPNGDPIQVPDRQEKAILL